MHEMRKKIFFFYFLFWGPNSNNQQSILQTGIAYSSSVDFYILIRESSKSKNFCKFNQAETTYGSEWTRDNLREYKMLT